MVFSQFLESSTGRSVIGMSLLFAWVYVSDYFEVIPLLAMTVQVLGTIGVYIWAKMGTSTMFKSKNVERGSDAPDIKGLESLDGSILSSFQGDAVNVVVFWATWCSRSRANLPTLNSYFTRYHNKADNVDFVGITAEPLSTVRAFLSRNVHRMNFPCASDPTGRVAKAYNVSSTPFAYVILDNKIQWSGIADVSLELAIKSAVYARKMKRREKVCEKDEKKKQ